MFGHSHRLALVAVQDHGPIPHGAATPLQPPSGPKGHEELHGAPYGTPATTSPATATNTYYRGAGGA